MNHKRWTILSAAFVAVLLLLATVVPALASPPAPDDTPRFPTQKPPVEQVSYKHQAAAMHKALDLPNPIDYQRFRARLEASRSGRTADASLLAQSGTDRVLVILVEFSGTDIFTWTAGVSQWDPYGRADPNENTGTVGDCSRIITQTTRFTYTSIPDPEHGPMHNYIPRPLGPGDRSADSIWTEDFSPEWYNGFLFGEGVVISYTMQDGTPVFVDFTGQSVADYYSDLSSGIYTITGDIIGWLVLPHTTWWYGADQCPGARSGGGSSSGAIPGAGSARTLVMDALDAVNAISPTIPGFSWQNYDRNGDGLIDRLWIVHAGYGEEDSTVLLNRTSYGEAALWSHSSSLTPPYYVGQGVYAGPYIMMPENGGIGVFAHEYGHNLGAPDLYAYGEGETSAGFWTLMADDWTGYPIGFEPPAVDPYNLDGWGWLNPYVITSTVGCHTVKIGQASRFPGGPDMYRAVRIDLPEAESPLPVPVWQGDYYWWGGHQDLSNARMTLVQPIALPEGVTATLEFDTAYGIETEWDFLWVQVSLDGVTWNYTDTLTNTNTTCEHDPSWIGPLYGFPDDLCGAGIGGFTDYNADFPDPTHQVFDLSRYAGQSIYLRFWYMTDWAALYEGPFIDSVVVKAGDTVLFSDDAEAGDANWVYEAPWQRSNGIQTFSHSYYLQWRNVNENGGYDSALGERRWRFGPANTGLLIWYNNNFYNDNEIFDHLFDWPGFGPKGLMLVVDSHPEPYRDPYWVEQGYNNEGGNVPHRSLMRDAPFTLQDTVDFTMTVPYVYTTTHFQGRPAVSSFYDGFGYYPGAEFVPGGPYQTAPRWMTKQWDASVVIPAQDFYGVKAPGYRTGQGTASRFRFDCTREADGYVYCYYVPDLGYDGGTGNPGDLGVQYGWKVTLIEEAEDHTWGLVQICNVPTMTRIYLPLVFKAHEP